MIDKWTWADGYPRDWPEGIELALRDLAGDQELSLDQLERYAGDLAGADNLGRMAELPAATDASQGKSDKSLEALHDACGKVVRILDDLHRPACEALAEENVRVASVRRQVAQMQEAARNCWGYTDAPEAIKGRKRSKAAAMVTKEAARIYSEITGRTATITKDPLTNEVSGQFASFLSACFASLYIRASVVSQVNSLRQKRPSKKTI